ncbi:MAG: hypothetical protein ACP5VP_12175 [Candidatus Limnocylindrales bacterium]
MERKRQPAITRDPETHSGAPVFTGTRIVVIDEDIPKELTPLFARPGLLAEHVEDIGLKGTKNGVLLAALSGNCDILVTGDTNVGHQQNLGTFDLAIVLIHPRRLVVE